MQISVKNDINHRSQSDSTVSARQLRFENRSVTSFTHFTQLFYGRYPSPAGWKEGLLLENKDVQVIVALSDLCPVIK